jgi:hypothetical protein
MDRSKSLWDVRGVSHPKKLPKGASHVIGLYQMSDKTFGFVWVFVSAGKGMSTRRGV